jgi:hypothetical protein
MSDLEKRLLAACASAQAMLRMDPATQHLTDADMEADMLLQRFFRDTRRRLDAVARHAAPLAAHHGVVAPMFVAITIADRIVLLRVPVPATPDIADAEIVEEEEEETRYV